MKMQSLHFFKNTLTERPEISYKNVKNTHNFTTAERHPNKPRRCLRKVEYSAIREFSLSNEKLIYVSFCL